MNERNKTTKNYINEVLDKEKEGKHNETFISTGFGLDWFYCISTIVGYLMPNPFLYI